MLSGKEGEMIAATTFLVPASSRRMAMRNVARSGDVRTSTNVSNLRTGTATVGRDAKKLITITFQVTNGLRGIGLDPNTSKPSRNKG